jgi:protein-disulfide isomerase
MDYFCGYCKKIHPELVELASDRDDVRVIFLQHPILSESSKVIAKMAIAANYQQKGFEFHHAILSISGSLNQEKLNQAIKDSGVNSIKLKIDSAKDEMEKIIVLSSFLAGGIGARGTPSIFVNEIFTPGYISKEQIINMLK